VYIPKGTRQRRLHKAFLRYHDPNNWPLLREALRRMGRADLIGNGRQHLVPTYQPIGTGRTHEGKRRPTATGARPATRPFRTQHTGLPKVPARNPAPGPSSAAREKAPASPAAGRNRAPGNPAGRPAAKGGPPARRGRGRMRPG
jgi:hypothetical protein